MPETALVLPSPIAAEGEDGGKAPRPALLPDPPLVATAAEAVGRDAFLLRGGLVDAWFVHRSDILLVTFDNLASVGEYAPPQPWLQQRAANAGLSILGLMASRKDWYRNPDTPALLGALRDAGLFARYRRVVFTGASMGGYAALAYSALVPGSVVLAFSPQTTLARKGARFDKRYRYGARKWDWDGPFADAAAATPLAAEVHVVFDPFVPEDRAHANRITGPNVRLIRAGHMGHRAIRQLKSVGVLQRLIEEVARGTFDDLAYAQAYRARRGVLLWQKALLDEAARRGHPELARRAARVLLRQNPDSRPARRAIDEPAAPQGPFAGTLLRLDRALVVPERGHDAKLASGVLTADGAWCKLSKAWIRAGKATPAPTLSPDEPVIDLPGTHLFAGHFRKHFGHFLVESTARLWALDRVGRLDGILFLPYRGDTGGPEVHAGFLRLLGITAPLQLPTTALRVEHLIVPELGFGWQARYAGSPAYRAFMQGRLRRVPPDGGPNLYISRARLKAERGGILAETAIEENLARAGFDIFHPERHPVETQIARYRAARRIVALDGSALHLAAYVVDPGTSVAMILRRSKANTADYILQYQSFAGITPQVIDAVRTDWVSAAADRSDFQSVGEVDFATLFARLQALGHVPPGFRADLPTDARIAAERAQFEARRGQPLRPLTPGERHPDED